MWLLILLSNAFFIFEYLFSGFLENINDQYVYSSEMF